MAASSAAARSGGDAQTLDVGGRRVRLTNPDKVLFPGDDEHGPTTKGELVDYYRRIAPVMLPHLAGRPVTRKRWPNGTEQQSFFTKNLDSGTPDWVPRAAVEHQHRVATYPLVEEEAALAWAAQLAAIELHVPQWRLPEAARDQRPGGSPYVLEEATADPDRLVVDLDPGPGTTMRDVARVALAARDILEGAGLAVFPVTSGSKGLHLYAGLGGAHAISSAQAREVSAELARALAAELPDLVVTSMKRAIRDGKVFVDHSQNNPAKTTVSPYSVRGRARPWVAAPRTWAEIEAAAEGEGLPQLTMAEVLERVAREGDLLAPLLPAGESPGAALPGPARPRAARRPRPSQPVVPSTPPPPTLARMPALPAPMLASTLDPAREAELAAPDAGTRWRFEPKWDGYRVLVVVGPAAAAADVGPSGGADEEATAVALVTRSGRDVTAEFGPVAAVPPALAGHVGILDAEVVALDEAGRPSFQTLQNRTFNGDRLRLMLFDVLELDGVDLVGHPLDARLEVLSALDLPPADPGRLAATGPGAWAQTEPLADTLAAAMRESRELDGEGVLAKRRDSRYQPGRRSGSWVKVKHLLEVRVVIGGFTAGQGRRAGGIGALLVGTRDDGGRLRYAGKVGTGFSTAALERLLARLRRLEVAEPPFAGGLDAVPRADARTATWVRPELGGEVLADQWTDGGRLRLPRWQGDVEPVE